MKRYVTLKVDLITAKVLIVGLYIAFLNFHIVLHHKQIVSIRR